MPGPTATRERLVRAAADLFYEQGVRATSVDAIVKRAGLTKPTLYQHFPSKDALIEAALELRDREHRERLLALRAQHPSEGAQNLLAAFELLESWLADGPGFRGCALVNAAVELADADHPGRAVVRGHKAWLRNFLEEDARRAGVDDPEALAEALLFLIEGATVTAYTEGRRDVGTRAKRAARALIDAATT